VNSDQHEIIFALADPLGVLSVHVCSTWPSLCR